MTSHANKLTETKRQNETCLFSRIAQLLWGYIFIYNVESKNTQTLRLEETVCVYLWWATVGKYYQNWLDLSLRTKFSKAKNSIIIIEKKVFSDRTNWSSIAFFSIKSLSWSTCTLFNNDCGWIRLQQPLLIIIEWLYGKYAASTLQKHKKFVDHISCCRKLLIRSTSHRASLIPYFGIDSICILICEWLSPICLHNSFHATVVTMYTEQFFSANWIIDIFEILQRENKKRILRWCFN